MEYVWGALKVGAQFTLTTFRRRVMTKKNCSMKHVDLYFPQRFNFSNIKSFFFGLQAV